MLCNSQTPQISLRACETIIILEFITALLEPIALHHLFCLLSEQGSEFMSCWVKHHFFSFVLFHPHSNIPTFQTFWISIEEAKASEYHIFLLLCIYLLFIAVILYSKCNMLRVMKTKMRYQFYPWNGQILKILSIAYLRTVWENRFSDTLLAGL